MRAGAILPFIFCVMLFMAGLLLAPGFLFDNKTDQLGKIIYHEYAYKTFAVNDDAETLSALRILCLACLVMPVFAFAFIQAVRTEARLLLKELWKIPQAIIRPWTLLSPWEKSIAALLLMACTAIRLWQGHTHPLSTDETGSYEFFVSQGWKAVTAFYPLPNNHIYFNLHGNLFYQLNEGIFFSMRLPAILISLVCIIILFLVMLRKAGFIPAILTASLLGLSRFAIFYSVTGRGYFLSSSWAMICFFSALAIWLSPGYKRAAMFAFVISSVLGIYTVPTFVYTWLAIAIWLLIIAIRKKRHEDLPVLIITLVFIPVFSVILYLPVILVSGYSSLAENTYVMPAMRPGIIESVIYYIKACSNLYLGDPRFSHWIFLLITVVFCFYAFNKKQVPDKRYESLGLILALFLPCIIMILQGVQAPDRTFFTQGIFFCIIAGTTMWNLTERLRIKPVFQKALSLIFILLFAVISVYFLESAAEPEKKRQAEIEALVPVVCDAREVYISEPHYQLFLLHFTRQKTCACKLNSEPDRSADLLVVARENEWPASLPAEDYSFTLEDERVKVYKRKSRD